MLWTLRCAGRKETVNLWIWNLKGRKRVCKSWKR